MLIKLKKKLSFFTAITVAARHNVSFPKSLTPIVIFPTYSYLV